MFCVAWWLGKNCGKFWAIIYLTNPKDKKYINYNYLSDFFVFCFGFWFCGGVESIRRKTSSSKFLLLSFSVLFCVLILATHTDHSGRGLRV